MSKAHQSADNAAILHGRQDEVAELENNGSELPWYKNSGMLRLNLAISAIFVAQVRQPTPPTPVLLRRQLTERQHSA